MKITVYCGSQSGNDPKYVQKAQELGRWIASSGHELVFGASDGGLMGAVAGEVLTGGAKVTGVVPDVPLIRARMHKGLSEYIFTKDMSERKQKMIELADAFIALPGGIGTLDEITEVLCLGQLRIHTKPSIFYNVDGFYEPLKEMFAVMEQTGFSHAEGNGRVLFAENINEIEEFLQ